MNERILQLALQAKLIASEYNGFDRTTITPAEKRFAELIVKECADIAERYGTPDGYYIAAEINRIMLNIRTDKGFGVEE